MKRYRVIAAALCILFVGTTVLAQEGDEIDWNARAPWGSLRRGDRGNWESFKKEPFQIFDNLYYVGLNTVSAYLITTSDGLILLDATYAETADFVLDSIRQLGFSPADLEYVIVSHGHGDHHAGAARIKEVTAARVVLSAEDWDFIESRDQMAGLTRDVEAKDGEELTLGDTTITFYVSPGHTPGSLTTTYTVRDGDQSYLALSPGGLGFNFGPESTATYIASIERLRNIGGFSVVLPNHPYMAPGDLFELMKGVDGRTDSATHPVAIGETAVNDWLDGILEAAREKLAAGQ